MQQKTRWPRLAFDHKAIEALAEKVIQENEDARKVFFDKPDRFGQWIKDACARYWGALRVDLGYGVVLVGSKDEGTNTVTYTTEKQGASDDR